MTPNRRTAADRLDESDGRLLGRRRLLALTGSTGVAFLAGCSGDGGTGDQTSGDDGDTGGNGGDADDGSDSTATDDGGETGTFRLLISDQPVAIDEFDSLEVSFDRARVFRSGGEDGEGEEGGEDTEAETPTAAPTATPTGNETTADNTTSSPEPTATETAADDEDDDDGDTEEEPEDGDDEESGGFTVIDLNGATVDLTQVLGDKALSVFEGGLPAGRYTKIELHAADIGGVVNGEAVDVKLPSEKLQITKPFEVAPEEALSFVFDITVVKKGNGGYNLKPVISESGVAGKDVPVEEIDEDEDGDGEEGNGEGSDDAESDEDVDGGTDGADDGEDGENGEDGDGGQPDDGTPTPEDA